MHKRIGSLILTVCLLLALTPETVMAATMERAPIRFQETSAPAEPVDQAVPAEQPKTPKKQPSAAAVSPALEGSGTTADPYRIKDAGQLRLFADAVNGVGGAPNTGICAVLTQNINLSDVCGADSGSWTPIGTNTNPYKGTFDGGSFSVSGLYCHKPAASYVGLFGSNAGIIKNLGVAGGSVSAGNYAGGLCGINKGTITGCYNTAAVSGDKYTGGICGCNDSGATVSVCYNTSAINGSKYVGGVCGYNKNATSDCYNTGTITGSGTSIGGICGYNKKLLSGCYNTGEVGGGTNYVGSICGYNHSGSTLVNCYYLITGTEKSNYGTGMTQQQFASGEVCYALNEGNGGSVAWKQTCGTGLPTFGGKTVYRAQTYKGDGSTVIAYTNDSNKKVAAYTAPAPYTAPSAGSSDGSTDDNAGEHTHVYQEPKWEWKKYESAKATLTCQDCGEEFILKASIKKEVTEPTCTEDGETVYTASVERDGITFKDKRVVEKERAGHTFPLAQITTNATVTCEKPIYTRDCYMCSACRKYFADENGKKELSKTDVGYKPALKHTYSKDPVWTWPAHNIATATFTCDVCKTQKPVAATVKLTKTTSEPTCEATGTCIYTATVNFQNKRYTVENPNGVVPAKGHILKLDPDGLQYKCTRPGCTYTVPLNGGSVKPTDPAPPVSPSTTENAPDNSANGETLPDDDAPSLLPGAEDPPETPTPSEGQDGSGEADTPEAPDGSDGIDTPEPPDNSGGQDTTDTPDKPDTSDGSDIPNAPGDSDGSGTPNPPDKPDISGSADMPNAPGESDTSDGTDVPPVSDAPGTADDPNAPETIENIMDMQENAVSYGLLCPEEEGVLIEGSAASLGSNAAVKSMTQPAGEQQEMSLWGSGIVLMLLVGIALLIILQKKHN